MRVSTQTLLLLSVFALCLVSSSVIQVQTNDDTASDPQPQKYTASENANNGNGNKYGLTMNYADFKGAFGKSPLKSSWNDKADREKQFKRNLKKLKEWDCEGCGVTYMFDWTEEEFNNLLGGIAGYRSQSRLLAADDSQPPVSQASAPIVSAAPLSWDWRTSWKVNNVVVNAVTPVKNQGQCGSCWSFSGAAFLESELVRRQITSNSVDLSEQYILKCDTASFGCSGGYLQTPLKLAIKTGMPTEANYPYKATTSYSTTMCSSPIITYKNFTTSKLFNFWNGSTRMGNAKIISRLARGPVIISVCASQWGSYAPTSTKRKFSCGQSYSNISCLNHAVLLVGYTQTEWIIKNSWGTSWGVNGYIYVNKNAKANCGIGFEIVSFNSPVLTPGYVV